MLGGAHTELLRSLLPDVLAALEKLLGADEELATEALEVLDEFLEADPAAVTPHLRPLLDLCLQVGGDAGRGDAVRARALATVAFVAQRCPKALLRGGLLPPLLGGLLGPLCAAPPPGRPDPEDEEDEEGGEAEGCGGSSPRHAAAQALDALAQALPPEKLLPPLLPLLEPLLGSPQPPARKGGLLALGALAEGCGELLHRRRRWRHWRGRCCRRRWRPWRAQESGRPRPRPGTSWRASSSASRCWARWDPGPGPVSSRRWSWGWSWRWRRTSPRAGGCCTGWRRRRRRRWAPTWGPSCPAWCPCCWGPCGGPPPRRLRRRLIRSCSLMTSTMTRARGRSRWRRRRSLWRWRWAEPTCRSWRRPARPWGRSPSTAAPPSCLTWSPVWRPCWSCWRPGCAKPPTAAWAACAWGWGPAPRRSPTPVACLEPGAGEEEEDDDEEQAELAAELRELAGEGLVALAQAVGGQLAPHLDELLPHVLARLEPRCSVGERSWAAATLAGLGGALGGAVSRFLPRLGPALGAAARDPHPEVRGNGLYALGVVAAAAGPALGPYPSGTRPLREATPPPLGGVGQAPPPPPLPFAHPGGGCNEGPGGGGEEPQGRPRPLRVAPPPVTPQPSGHAHTPPWPRPQPVTPQPSGHTPPPPPACDVRILWPRPHSLATPPLPVMSQPLATPTHPGHAPPTCDIRAPWPRPPHRALTSQPSGHAHTPPGHAPPAPVTLEPSGHAHPPSGHSPFL
ncbi:importin-4 isoform X5 [Rhea pennata]|uniref:importin-4 isoform X5 n=1 Tax=Rhea pennata TaxID=8795 RepID=UPI002E261AC7